MTNLLKGTANVLVTLSVFCFIVNKAMFNYFLGWHFTVTNPVEKDVDFYCLAAILTADVLFYILNRRKIKALKRKTRDFRYCKRKLNSLYQIALESEDEILELTTRFADVNNIIVNQNKHIAGCESLNNGLKELIADRARKHAALKTQYDEVVRENAFLKLNMVAKDFLDDMKKHHPKAYKQAMDNIKTAADNADAAKKNASRPAPFKSGGPAVKK